MARVIIGQLALKVMPDTDGFREEVKAKAERIEQGLDPVEVPLEADSAGLKQEVKKTVADAEKTAGKVSVGVELDNKEATAESLNTRDKIKDILSGIKSSVGIDNTELIAELKTTRAMIQSTLKDIELQVRLSNDSTRNMGKQLQEFMTIATAKPMLLNAPVIETKSLYRQVGDIRSHITTQLGKINIKFDPIKDPFEVFKRSSGLRIFAGLAKEKWEIASNFDTFALKAGGLTLAFEALSASILASTGNLLSWSKDVASIGALLIPLPGILAGVGLAAWTVSNAFKDAGKYLPGFASQWTELKQAMSENFWAKAQKPMQNMIDKLFPAFSKGMKQVSKDMGGLIGALAGGFTKHLSEGNRLGGMMTNLSKAVQIATKGMDSLAEGLSRLLSIGMAQLPALAGYFNKLTASFAEFMRTNENNGNFTKWIDTAVVNFQALSSVVASTGRIFWGLATAMQTAGASTLTSLSATMQRAADIVTSGPFQAGLASFMSDVYAFTGAVGAAMGNGIKLIATNLGPVFGEALRNLGPVMADSLNRLFAGLTKPESAKNFQSFFDDLKIGLDKLDGSFDILGYKVSIVASLIGSAFKNLTPIVNAFGEEMGRTLEKVQQPLKDLFTSMGGTTEAMLTSLGPAFDSVGDSMAQLFTSLSKTSGSMKSFAPIVGSLGGILANAFGGIVNMITPVMDNLATKLPGIAKELQPLIGLVMQFSTVLKPLGGLLGSIASLIGGVVLDAFKGLLQGINFMIEGIKQVFAGFKQMFSGGWSNFWNGLKNVALGVLKMILGGVLIWANVTLLGAIRGGLLKILTHWKGGWTALKTFGTTIMNTMKAGWTGFWNMLRGLFTSGVATVKSVWSGGLNTVKALATSAWAALKAGVTSMKTAVVAKFREMGTSIMSTVRQIPGILRGIIPVMVAAGIDIVGGVISGIQQKAGAVLQAASDLAGSVASAFKGALNINSPSRVFRDIAASIPEGVAVGIDKNAKLAVNAAKDMADAIAGVGFEMQDIKAPNMGSFNAKALQASVTGLDSGLVGDGVVVNQTFNAADMDPSDVARRARIALREVEMSGHYGGGSY